MLEKYLHIHPEVQKSISSGEPIVALDSSMIFNNLNYPENIEVSNNLCKIIRNNGAIPATMAIIHGVLKIGLTEDELEFISLNKDLSFCSNKNLPFIISEKLTGTTSLDTSIIMAYMAGIKIIATSEINYPKSPDQCMYNLNLHELANKDITIITSKNIQLYNNSNLDQLNAFGISVIEYSSSGASKSPMDIAKSLRIKYDLNLDGCMIVNNLENKNFDIESIYNNALLASEIAKNLSMVYQRK
ncbi:MAG: pseudouridine-5'-phosphate glycosidase [Peptostreptococcaceae bacterium]